MEFPETYVIEIEADRVANLMKEFIYDYSIVGNHLKLIDRRMAITKPKRKDLMYNSDMESVPEQVNELALEEL